MHLTEIHDLVSRTGPFVTVHADVGRTTEDAPQQLDARWTTIRHALEHEGVGADLIDEIGQRLHEPPPGPGPARRTIVAEGGEVVLDEVLAGTAPEPVSVSVDPLPDLAAYVALADRLVPFALVVADREGADVTFSRGLAATDDEQRTVEGEEFGITKVPQGDWKQAQYQRAVENTWQRTADDIAAAVRRGVEQHRPEVVILAGEERMCGDIEHALEGLQLPVVRVSGGGRAAGASEEALEDDVRRVLAELEARRDDEIAQELLARSGRHAGAARGLDEVLDAFVLGQVACLVLDPDAAREMTVDPADHPGLRLPGEASGPQPADRVLIAAAAATDADVSVLPRAASKGAGVAAILRWD